MSWLTRGHGIGEVDLSLIEFAAARTRLKSDSGGADRDTRWAGLGPVL
jgi:hypothetical protein